MKSDWTQSFATAGVALVILNELEHLENSFGNEEISQEVYNKRKAELEKMQKEVLN